MAMLSLVQVAHMHPITHENHTNKHVKLNVNKSDWLNMYSTYYIIYVFLKV